MKFVSFLNLKNHYNSNCSKKSSGRIDPNNNPWLVLNETTPCPKRRGLIELFNTTDGAFAILEFCLLATGTDFEGYKNNSKTNIKYCWHFHWMHIFACITIFTRTLLPKSTRNWFFLSHCLYNSKSIMMVHLNSWFEFLYDRRYTPNIVQIWDNFLFRWFIVDFSINQLY